MAVVSINGKENKIENIAIYKLEELESTSKSRLKIMEEITLKNQKIKKTRYSKIVQQ